MLNCPECTHREKVKVQEKYEQDVEEEDRDRNELFKLFDSEDEEEATEPPS